MLTFPCEQIVEVLFRAGKLSIHALGLKVRPVDSRESHEHPLEPFQSSPRDAGRHARGGGVRRGRRQRHPALAACGQVGGDFTHKDGVSRVAFTAVKNCTNNDIRVYGRLYDTKNDSRSVRLDIK
ncbi:hypothetical protein [Actinomadura sp. HBU206391]|uniref:hypothetical protein n=1 Tax=Actinomadura sp. HBU206391 TaxID=2731692 RepID=UPI00164F7E09|nr:hypothetical protein [Actinomadura sp. HBU206391]MBC6457910.1 hypothetical protein [Actinomadura sp. HBU206391]